MPIITSISDLNPDQVPVSIKARIIALRRAPQALVSQEGKLKDETGKVAFAVWKDAGVKGLKIGRDYILYRVGLGKREGKLEVRVRKGSRVIGVKKEKDVVQILGKITYQEQVERRQLAKGAKITASDWGPSKKNIFSILITIGVILWLIIMGLHFSGILTEKQVREFFHRKKALFQSRAIKKAALLPREGMVEEVVEGGLITVRVEGKLWIVHYLGLEVPRLPLSRGEAVDPWVIRAFNFNKYQAEGKEVRLEFEEWIAPEGKEVWAYVFAGDKMLNEALLERGLARLTSVPKKLKYGEILRSAEDSARASHRGIWGKGRSN